MVIVHHIRNYKRLTFSRGQNWNQDLLFSYCTVDRSPSAYFTSGQAFLDAEVHFHLTKMTPKAFIVNAQI